MIKSLTFITALLLLLCSTLSAQDGIEELRKVLSQRSAANTDAAIAAWQLHGDKFLETGDRDLMSQLQTFKPEIQTPVFAALKSRIGDTTKLSETSRILQLLNTVLDHSSAARLLTMLDQLPASEISKSMYAIIKYGSPATQLNAQKHIAQADEPLLQSIIESSLLYADESYIPKLSKLIDYSKFDLEELGAIFEILAEREFSSELYLDPKVFEITDKDFRIGLLILLAAYPQAETANYFIAESIGDGLEPQDTEIHALAISAFEAGAKQFKWSRYQNQYQRFLKATPDHRLAVDIAWCLHRLEDNKGTNFLLAEPEREYRENNGSWPYAVQLGTMQVKLGLHSDAYKVFHRAHTQGVKNQQVRRLMKRQDFVWAARAAAGAKRPSDALDWLNDSGLSLPELHEVGKFDEFAPYLDNDKFIALFGLDN
ncbi:MAG: hypothetical protein ACI84O_001408 [Myxococcota bacterium]|jgi:hypothetical protein